MSCNISVPIEDIAESVAQMLRQQFIEKDGGTGTGNTLTDTVLRGGLTFDATAKQAICDAIERCVAEQIKESQAEQDADIDDKINAGDDRLEDKINGFGDRLEDKINGFEDRIDAGRIVGVTRKDDTVTVKLANGNEFPFSITDSSSGGDRPVQFAPSSNGDNIEITLADGSVLDMTRQEFADWLAGDESPLTTDEELEALANDIANNIGDLQSQIDALNDKFKSINYDQAMLFVRGLNLVLKNEDGTESIVALKDLIPISSQSGQQIEWRDDGIYYGDVAPPDVSSLYVDAQDGDDSNSGTYESPLRTIDEASRRVDVDKSSTIYLKATYSNGQPQVHLLSRDMNVDGTAIRSFKGYDYPEYTAEIRSCLANGKHPVQIYGADELTRPIISRNTKLYRRGSTERQSLNCMNMSNGGAYKFYGVVNELTPVKYSKDEYPISYEDLFRGSGSIKFSGSDFLDVESLVNLGRTTNLFGTTSGAETNIVFLSSQIVSDRKDRLTSFISAETSRLNLTVGNYAYIVQDEGQSECNADFTMHYGNMEEFLSLPNIVSHVNRHSSGVPTNVTSNFDL